MVETYQIICPDCGEVLATYNEEYAIKYPNSLDMWEAQLLEEHAIVCPNNEEYKPEIIDEFYIKDKKFQIEVNYYSDGISGIREYYSLIPSKGSMLPDVKSDCWFEYIEEVIATINKYILEESKIRDYELETNFILTALYELKFKFLEWYTQNEKKNPYIQEGYYAKYKEALEKGMEIKFKTRFILIRGIMGGEFLEEIILPTLEGEKKPIKRSRRRRKIEEIEEIKEEA